MNVVKSKDKMYETPVPLARPVIRGDFRGSVLEGGLYRRNHRRVMRLLIALSIIAVLFLSACLYIIVQYTVENVYVNGNVHYTNREVEEMVMTGPMGDNSLYLSLKYRNKGVEGIPFVDEMDVDIVDRNTIMINVYEKALAGYIEYMDTYMYFDKDGYVVECSDEKTVGIPQITGLDFDYMVMGQMLPVEDEQVFESIMELTKLLDKYELDSDRIYFAQSGDVTIYFGDIKADIGSDSANFESRLMRLSSVLPELDGMSGTLRMENVTESNTSFNFEED